MAVSFQYNKTSLNNLNKQLKIRLAALPILKNKETALRVEVIRQRKECRDLESQMEVIEEKGRSLLPLVGRFPIKMLTVETLDITEKKIAGVQIPVLNSLNLEFKPILWHEAPHWYTDVLAFLQELIEASVKFRVANEQLSLLENERKRTTQKVNLFEKVQIPEYEDAIKKIKKYLEDKENLSKAAQKIVKARKMQ